MRAVFVVALVLLTGSALGQDRAERAWYLSADAGVARLHVDRAALDARAAAAGVVVRSSSLDRDAFAFRVSGGYQINRNAAIEGGYVNLGRATYGVSASLPANGSGEATARAHGFEVLARLVLPISQGVAPYVMAGGAYMQVRAALSGSVPGIAVIAARTSADVVPVLGFGVEARLAPSVAARIQWARYFDIGDDAIGRANVSMLSAGVAARF